LIRADRPKHHHPLPTFLHLHLIIAVMVLQPPPATDYPTLDALMEAVQAHAVAEGYAVVKARSKATYKSGAIAKVGIVCDRGGKSRSKPRAKKRKTASIKCDCSFKVNALYNQSLKVWKTEVRNAKHSHEEDEVPDASAATRRSDKTAELLGHIDATTRSDTIIACFLFNCSTKPPLIDATPREILSELRLQNLECLLIDQDIYNLKKKLRRNRLDVYIPT